MTTPNLNFRIDGAEAVGIAAVPTLWFKLHIDETTGASIRSLTIQVQLRIAAAQRHYSADEQTRLIELFGRPDAWNTSLKGFLWTNAIVLVPKFTGTTQINLPVTCTYDFDVLSAKYFSGLDDGDIPLEFLFSGTVFYDGPDGDLQVVQISWEKEADFRLPVLVWKQMMQSYFKGTAWVRLKKDTFDRLYGYKSRHGHPTWEAALDELLGQRDAKVAS